LVRCFPVGLIRALDRCFWGVFNIGKKKRHHYIPCFYLNGFIDPANEPFIWVYQKGESQIIKATAANIALEKHYYSFTTPTGAKDSETFENALSEIEGKAAPLIEKIKKHQTLDNDDRAIFAAFLALMMTRVPNYRKILRKCPLNSSSSLLD
jgi:hypothetical protein